MGELLFGQYAGGRDAGVKHSFLATPAGINKVQGTRQLFKAGLNGQIVCHSNSFFRNV
jgi:hypothetical protein